MWDRTLTEKEEVRIKFGWFRPRNEFTHELQRRAYTFPSLKRYYHATLTVIISNSPTALIRWRLRDRLRLVVLLECAHFRQHVFERD